jgi:hypothetical protein
VRPVATGFGHARSQQAGSTACPEGEGHSPVCVSVCARVCELVCVRVCYVVEVGGDQYHSENTSTVMLSISEYH